MAAVTAAAPTAGCRPPQLASGDQPGAVCGIVHVRVWLVTLRVRGCVRAALCQMDRFGTDRIGSPCQIGADAIRVDKSPWHRRGGGGLRAGGVSRRCRRRRAAHVALSSAERGA